MGEGWGAGGIRRVAPLVYDDPPSSWEVFWAHPPPTPHPPRTNVFLIYRDDPSPPQRKKRKEKKERKRDRTKKKMKICYFYLMKRLIWYSFTLFCMLVRYAGFWHSGRLFALLQMPSLQNLNEFFGDDPLPPL